MRFVHASKKEELNHLLFHPWAVMAATAEGQREIIESYGVTEEFSGAPIRSCMDVRRIGSIEDGRMFL